MNKMLHGGSANTAPDTIIRAKMTPEARRRRALRFKKAWELARAEGALTFKFDGDSYSTKKKGESDKYWARHFKDKTTVSGQHNVLSNVAYGWEGVPGASPGYFDSNGKFVKLVGNSNSTPLRIKGDKYAINGLDASGYAEVDMPEDTITYSTGSNRGRSGTNTRTGITIGKSPKGKKVSRPETNREANNRVDKSYIAHWTPGDMFEVATPDFAISNAIASATLGKDYKPVMSSSGLNPFGYVEDISKTLNGNTNSAVNLGLRGLSTWTYAGAPGMSEGADYLATRFAPNMVKGAKSMKYIPKGGTNSGRLNSWNINSLSSGTGGRGVSEFGHRSMQRAINEGAVSGVGNGAATRWGTNAAQNANTGTTYIFRGNPNAYDKVADLAVSMTPWAAYAESEAALTANGISKRK